MEYKMFSIRTNTKCNLNCVYCNEGYRERGELIDLKFEGYDKINSKIKNNLIKGIKNFNGVTFTSGEPTLNPLLPDLIKFSKELGYKKIELITNGTRISNKEYLKKLVFNGLDTMVISVNTFNKDLSQIISGFDGQSTLKGIINAVKNNIDLTVNIVITKHTLLTLKQTLLILEKINVKKITLSYIRYEDFEIGFGNSKVNYNKVSYSDITRYIKDNNLQTFIYNFGNISFNDFPICILLDLVKNLNNIRFGAEHSFYDKNTDAIKIRRYFGKGNRDYLEKCSNCKYLKQCTGLEKEYIKIFGNDFVDKEIKPYL